MILRNYGVTAAAAGRRPNGQRSWCVYSAATAAAVRSASMIAVSRAFMLGAVPGIGAIAKRP